MDDFVIRNNVLEKYTGKGSVVRIPEGVTSIGSWAFGACSSLTSIVIPDSVTNIGDHAFDWCSSLTSIVIPDSVTSIGGGAFSRCSSLTSIVIPDSVTSIEEMAFGGCSSLTSIVIPDSVTSIGSVAFYGCSSLTSITLPEGVKIEKYAFPAHTNITYRPKKQKPASSVSTADANMPITDSQKCEFMIKNGILKTYLGSNPEIVIPESVRIIENSAFARHQGITSAEIPDSVTEIRDYAFAGCSSLNEITLPQNLKLGERVFYQCSHLTTVKIRFPGGLVGTFDKTALDNMFQKI